MDFTPIACPAANSTFVVDKNLIKNMEECVSPEMFSPDSAKESNANKTYDMPQKLSKIKKLVKPIDSIPEEAAENNKFKQPQPLTICNSKKKRYFFLCSIHYISNYYFLNLICVLYFVVWKIKSPINSMKS